MYLHFFVVCIYLTVTFAPNYSANEIEEEVILKNARRLLSTHGIKYSPIMPPLGSHLSLFIHAVSSDFGIAILDEMLENIRSKCPELLSKTYSINIGTLGDTDGNFRLYQLVRNFRYM